ncbi:flagellar motor switch protein FliM [Clostridium lacusfryxellense]|uniref:flagellar motor switch protein FliM n=1 Tax=Clostridium lacusfryxellense TaxID=205328 RepID=UPI001C0C53F9|nr:flagellar motor switch protein FliM [Clostridium lacusfryxellense]MBU3111755.1 flagellar motor switch protein FliM [Clostridium lacusfryxellense]
MAEVLSQSDIDSLLSALSSGEIEADQIPNEEEKHRIKLYDFKSPQKFSKDHLRALELIHDNYARLMASYLSAQLRNNVKVKVESTQQITYDEFIHSIPNSTVLTIFKMPPLSGSILFELNPQFASQIIDILLGGNGGRPYKFKEFSDIDKNILRNVNTGLIANLKTAWQDVLSVEPEILAIETNPALNQTLAPNEPVALITFSVEMNNSSSFINVCIPYLSIEKIIDKLVVQYWFRENDDENVNDSRSKLKERLNIVSVPITGVLGGTNITVDEFLQLTEGDVITLDNSSDSQVKVFVENRLCYTGKPGIIGKNRGIQILDIIDKDVENYE